MSVTVNKDSVYRARFRQFRARFRQ